MKVLLRLAIIALAGVTVLQAPADAQGRNPGQRNVLARLAFQSAAERNASAWRDESAVRSYRRRAEAAEGRIAATQAQLARLRTAGTRSAGQVRTLEQQLEQQRQEFTQAAEGYAEELARRDRDYARERSILLQAGERLLETEEGRRALDLYLAGGRDNWMQARQVLETMRRIRRAMDAREVAILYLGARNRGEETTAAVIAIYEEVVRDDDSTFADWLELARLYRASGNLSSASRAIRSSQSLPIGDRERLMALAEDGEILSQSGDVDGALGRYQAALTIAERLVRQETATGDNVRDVNILRNKIADILANRGEIQEALSLYRESLTMSRLLVEANPENSVILTSLAATLATIGDLALDTGDSEAAAAFYTEAIGIVRDLARADPTLVQNRRNLAVLLNKGGEVALADGDPVAAIDYFSESLEIVQSLARADSSSSRNQQDLLITEGHLGDALRMRGNLSAAREHYELSLGIAQALASSSPSPRSFSDLSLALQRVGNVLVMLGDRAGAWHRYEQALAIAQRLAREDPTSVEAQTELADLLWHLATHNLGGITWPVVANQYDQMQSRSLIRQTDEPLALEARRRAGRQTRQ